MNVAQVITLGAYPRRLTKSVLETYFEAITRSNVAWLLLNRRVPNLYDSGIFYERDPDRGVVAELWLDVPAILQRGYDDCEGLSCWLAAEMRARENNSVGTKRVPTAACWLKRTRVPGSWHAIVRDAATGQTWDPSRVLGMGQRRRRYAY